MSKTEGFILLALGLFIGFASGITFCYSNIHKLACSGEPMTFHCEVPDKEIILQIKAAHG